MSAAECAAATGGRVLAGDPEQLLGGAVVIDSRTVSPGDLFVAVPGERVDGHEHAAAAFAAGAAAVLVHLEPSALHAGPDAGGATILVPDTTAALADLARSVHRRLSAAGTVTVAVTGSMGKTTTKDLLAQLLSDRRVVTARGSFNNELGMPLTVLRADATTEVLVLEMGARSGGHIAHLCEVARPDVAVVLGVGSAHLGEFGSTAATAAAKSELVRALDSTDPAALAVLNADDPLVAAMSTSTRASVLSFGESPSADVRAVDVELDDDALLRFRLVASLPGTGSHERVDLDVRTRLVGEQQLPNVLAAATVALRLGVPPARLVELLGDATATSPHRMQVTDRPDGIRVVDDAYNANPESTGAALRALAHMGRARAAAGGRTWAVLGEMLELGAGSRDAHDRLGRLAVRLDIDRLVAVGSGALALHAAARHEGSWGEESVHVPDVDAARRLLADELAPGDVVLVKASNSIGLWRLAAELADGSPAAGVRA